MKRLLTALFIGAVFLSPAQAQIAHFVGPNGYSPVPVSAADPMPVTGNIVCVSGCTSNVSGVTIADGADTGEGLAAAAAACADGSAKSVLGCLAQLHKDVTGAIPAGTASIGTLNSSTAYGLQSAASTNATSVKGSAGTLTGMTLENTTTTVYYLRMYNLASAPTCSSATGFVRSWAVPPASSAGLVGGIAPHLPAGGTAFTTGIAFCLTGGFSSTDNTNAATGVLVNLDYQ